MKGISLLLYVLFQTVLFAWSATGHTALRAHLTHIDHARGFTKRDLLRRMAARTLARVEKRWSPSGRGHRGGGGGGADAATVTSSVSREEVGPSAEYLIHFGIGTPRPQHVALVLDTSSDLIWTQCGCAVCFDQPFPSLDTSASATHRGVSCFDPVCASGGLPFSGCALKDNFCFYAYSYRDKSVTTGKIYEDTFTFQAASDEVASAAAAPSLRYGCGMYNNGIFTSSQSGVAGFGRGPMSLPSQLKVSRFSHCFTTIGESRSSPLFLGSTPDNLEAQATGPIQSTPFVPSPEGPDSSLYYLSLKGVTVGKRRLRFDASAFALRGDGSGGTVIDSRAGITTFPRAVYESLREAFASQVQLPADDLPINDADSILCFDTSDKQKAAAVHVPKLILNLDGANWDLPRESYLLGIEFPDDNGTVTGTALCVAVSTAGDSDKTIIGNFQQQNTHIAYDLDSNKLSFVPARCHKL